MAGLPSAALMARVAEAEDGGGPVPTAGRSYVVATGHGTTETLSAVRFKVMCYNILAQTYVRSPVFPYSVPSALKWRHRRQNLLEEMLACDADVLCLMDVDNYAEWWRPELTRAGYDGVYKKRPGYKKDGVAIFFRRNLYQLFNTLEVEFNDIEKYLPRGQKSAKVLQDDVALVLALQPWEDSTHPSAVCVVCAQLAKDRHPSLAEVRRLQLKHLMRTVEEFNSDFHLPVIVCGSLAAAAHSEIYHIVTTGCMPEKPALPGAPPRPTARATSRTSMRVEWAAPACGDAPLAGYRVLRRAGGNAVAGYAHEQRVDGGHTLACNVTGLASGITYEFIIRAETSVGLGPYSQPSVPAHTPKNVANPPAKQYLKAPVKADFVEDGTALDAHFDATVADSHGSGATNLTPRFEDGVLHPTLSPSHQRTGVGSRRSHQVHYLGLQSAYAYYQEGAEPTATHVTEGFKGCVDYIFFSGEYLAATRLLTLPDMERCKDVDVRRPEFVPDPRDVKPKHWDDRERVMMPDYDKGVEVEVDNPDYMGPWEPRLVPNPDRMHRWLPNAQLSSDHVALCCEFAFLSGNLTSHWN